MTYSYCYAELKFDKYCVNIELDFEKVFSKKFWKAAFVNVQQTGKQNTNFSTNLQSVMSKQMMSCCFLMLYIFMQ